MELKVTTPEQFTKAIRLMTFANNIGIDLSDICCIVCNAGSKETYMWHNNYAFELLISNSSNDIVALCYDCDSRIDREMVCTEDTTLAELIEWAKD